MRTKKLPVAPSAKLDFNSVKGFVMDVLMLSVMGKIRTRDKNTQPNIKLRVVRWGA